MKKKALKDLVIGDKVYFISKDSYEVAELNCRSGVNGEGYTLGFKVCGRDDELIVVSFGYEVNSTSLFIFVEDWQLDVLVTTDKEEVIDYYNNIINVCKKIIENVKEGNEVVEEY